jgi:DNA-binding LacI/PurR family transcriptional regulator
VRLPAASPAAYGVAARAGVTIGTASRVLIGPASLRPGARERVLAAIRDLEYVPGGAARSLPARSARAVALAFCKPPGPCASLTTDEEEGPLRTAAAVRGAEHARQHSGSSLLMAGAGGPRSVRALTPLSALAGGLTMAAGRW